MAQRLAVHRQPRCAVGQIAEVLLLADRQAEVRQRAEAVDALPALGREQRHHVVARRDERDALADSLDHACALVTEDGRGIARGIDPRGRVDVGVAYAAGPQANQHLAGAGLREVDLADHQGLCELLEDGGFDLHRGDPIAPRMVSRPCSAGSGQQALLAHQRLAGGLHDLDLGQLARRGQAGEVDDLVVAGPATLALGVRP